MVVSNFRYVARVSTILLLHRLICPCTTRFFLIRTSKFTWHIAEELGILQPSRESAAKERAYMGLARPITEYATTAWSPHTQKDIQRVESVQRRAARFVHKDYSRHSSATSMLQSLERPDSVEEKGKRPDNVL